MKFRKSFLVVVVVVLHSSFLFLKSVNCKKEIVFVYWVVFIVVFEIAYLKFFLSRQGGGGKKRKGRKKNLFFFPTGSLSLSLSSNPLPLLY